MILKVGDKVKLVTVRYGDKHSDPKWNGKYGQIKGTIYKIRGKGKFTFYDVRWENGCTNEYYKIDLKLIKKQKKVKISNVSYNIREPLQRLKNNNVCDEYIGSLCKKYGV